MKIKYDIFINYRRDSGQDAAKLLVEKLRQDNYNVSFDQENLGNGDFNKQLLKRIEECEDFILICDARVFDRILENKDEKDWLRVELAKAFPKELPSDIDKVRYKNKTTNTILVMKNSKNLEEELLVLTPTTTLNKPSAFINAGVTKPCILISCNDWNICDSILFNREMVLKDKGKVKKVVILKDDYTTDTLSIKDDLLGVAISYRPINFMTVDLLRQLFFGYCVKKKCNWKIRCFLVQNLWNKEQYNNFNT